jgi:hypothetical protein
MNPLKLFKKGLLVFQFFTSPLTFGRLWPTAGLFPLQNGEGEGELPKGSSEGGEV